MTATPGADEAPVVTVFRSRLRPESAHEYHETADRILDLARTMPGFVDFKSFEAADGERVSIVTFASRQTHQAWRDHPEHRARPAHGPRPLLRLVRHHRGRGDGREPFPRRGARHLSPRSGPRRSGPRRSGQVEKSGTAARGAAARPLGSSHSSCRPSAVKSRKE